MNTSQEILPFCTSLTEYKRRETVTVTIGDLPMGSLYPIRVQSMTTVDTMDTQGSIDQCIRMIEAGCEYIRITAPSINEARNLENIKKGLVNLGYTTPLIADIHFTPNAAEYAARVVEKVRINPGNYIDKKKFEVLEYSDSEYQAELDKIRERFVPLVRICKEYGTAMRIGTNHGSLSDRIMSRFGDTPFGMVESALEFLKICEDENYYNIVLSMKSSNTQVMVQAYRLLVARLSTEGYKSYPLHLGVTEAGEGEDGRIKSAVGIGALLEDGIGDTIRVSLTEEPEYEIPVAKQLVDRYINRSTHAPIPSIVNIPKDPYIYQRRHTVEIGNIGYENVPRVIADLSDLSTITDASLKEIGHFYLSATDKWTMNDLGSDYIYSGKSKISFMLPNGLKEIVDANIWHSLSENADCYPLYTVEELDKYKGFADINFVLGTTYNFSDEILLRLKNQSVVLVIRTDNDHAMAEIRAFFYRLAQLEIQLPVVVQRAYSDVSDEQLQIYSATDVGSLLIDGFGDGIWLKNDGSIKNHKMVNQTSFGILQAARTRMSKTEYISCPSCGRTLFDLQETTAMIRKRTDHLKGVKIGIMGCIVNGPGEMADADYGYVGSGKGKITLYKGQEVVKRSVSSEFAVDELIEIIRNDGRWTDPTNINELT